jgi:glycosyltransferase involved in cell wall biosynthesis
MSGSAVTRARSLAFVCPLPPVRSGIADYARDLLPLVARDFAVECFVDDRHPLAGRRFGEIPVHPASALRPRYAEFAHVVYQMGNNLHHRFVLELATRLPGIVVLHDLVLHHLYEEIVGREDAWDRYEEALRESYGRVGDFIVRTKRWRMASEAENFAFPLFESLAARSRGVIVHNRAVEREVRRRVPGIPLARMPMGIPASRADDRGDARGRLGVAADAVVVASFGFLIPTKRIDVLAPAFREARRRSPALRLVLIGEECPGFDLRGAFREDEFASGVVEHRGYVSSEEYADWMAATDVAVNLRYPTAGETSASLLRLLWDGKCTLVSGYRQFLEIPEDAVVRIPLGPEESPTLVRELVALAEDPVRRRRIGAAARRFVEREHSMEAAARAFREAVAAISSAPARPRLAHPLWSVRRTSRVAAIAGSVAAVDETERTAAPGGMVEVEVAVRNTGESSWVSTPDPLGGHVALGFEIEKESGEALRLPTALLSHDLAPGAEARVRLSLRAPGEPGSYRIRPVLVHVGRSARRRGDRPLSLVVAADAR